jgi:hypothetical protein
MAKIKVTSESVEAAEAVLTDLKAKAKKAHEDEDAFMMGLMTDLISAASPIVTRAINRLHREDRAKINKAHAKLRKKIRETSEEEAEE